MSIPEQPQTPANVKVDSLNPQSRQLNLTVKVVKKGEARETVSRSDGSSHKVVDALVGDETGAIYMTLWDDNIEKVKDGDIIDVKNGYVSLFKGSMRLNIGRFGSFEASQAAIAEVNDKNNLSDKTFEQERRPYPSFRPRYGDEGGYRGGGGRGGGGGGFRGRRRRF
jgi:ssDNA-binding replication factor A large subunit